MQCWEFKKCGRQQGGAKAAEMGVCPAHSNNAGEACWLVAGTFCKGEVQGTFAEKQKNCMNCDFFKQFDLAHKSRVRKQFEHLTAA